MNEPNIDNAINAYSRQISLTRFMQKKNVTIPPENMDNEAQTVDGNKPSIDDDQNTLSREIR